MSNAARLAIPGTGDDGKVPVYDEANDEWDLVPLPAGGAELPVFNVKDYGAVGDGETDDTEAIQDAIDAAAATTAGGVVWFPPGSYRLTAKLATINTHRVQLAGAGSKHTTLVFDDLDGGDYAITLVSSGTVKRAILKALTGLYITQASHDAAWHCLQLGAGAARLVFDDVTIDGFGDQVTYGSNTYITAFTNCHLYAAQARGVVAPSTSSTIGERLNFVSCLFGNSPGTLIDFDHSGVDAYFFGCSFDYSARALRLRAGQASFLGCHFEADNTYAADVSEYVLVDRRGSVGLPQLLISGGQVYPAWSDYDTFIRCEGENFGGSVVALRDVRIFSDPTTTCPYLIRDDAPSASDISYSGLMFTDTTQSVLPKYRTFAGADFPLTHAGQPFGPKAARPLRRTHITAIEPLPADRASSTATLVDGTIYHVLFRPTEDIAISKIAVYTAGTAAAGSSLQKVAVYQQTADLGFTKLAESDGTAFAGSTFSRRDVTLTSTATCRAGSVYALSVLFVGGTMPVLAAIPNGNSWVTFSVTYGHVVAASTASQTDMPTSIAAGSVASTTVIPYIVGSTV